MKNQFAKINPEKLIKMRIAFILCAVSLIIMGVFGFSLMWAIFAGMYRIRFEVILYSAIGAGAILFISGSVTAAVMSSRYLVFSFSGLLAFPLCLWVLDLGTKYVRLTYWHTRYKSLEMLLKLDRSYIFVPFIIVSLTIIGITIMMWFLYSEMSKACRIFTILTTIIMSVNILFWVILISLKEYYYFSMLLMVRLYSGMFSVLLFYYYFLKIYQKLMSIDRKMV